MHHKTKNHVSLGSSFGEVPVEKLLYLNVPYPRLGFYMFLRWSYLVRFLCTNINIQINIIHHEVGENGGDIAILRDKCMAIIKMGFEDKALVVTESLQGLPY